VEEAAVVQCKVPSRHLPKGTKENHEYHGQDIRSPGLFSYEAGVPTTRLCRLVFSVVSELKELCYYLNYL
jgi:hypothetical protein